MWKLRLQKNGFVCVDGLGVYLKEKVKICIRLVIGFELGKEEKQGGRCFACKAWFVYYGHAQGKYPFSSCFVFSNFGSFLCSFPHFFPMFSVYVES